MPKISDSHPIHQARKRLISIIEDHAFFNRISMAKAGQQIVNDHQYFALVVEACGQWFTGRPPSARVLLKWYDRDKMDLARQHPNLSPDDHRKASPYLPVKYRQKLSSWKRTNREYAQRLLAKGYDRKTIAEMLSVSIPTVYRWLPKKPKKPAPTSQGSVS